MKLISMTDFTIGLWDKDITREDFAQKSIRYATFLKAELKLWMFVPCDLNGNILKGKPLSPAPDSEWIRWENEEFEFYNARDKVVFDGFVSGIFTGSKDNHFEWIDEKLLQIRLYTKDVGSNKWIITDNKLKTVEDLIRFGFELQDDAF